MRSLGIGKHFLNKNGKQFIGGGGGGGTFLF